MIFHIKLIGIILMFLALVHIGFPKYFKWKDEFSTVSLINRQMNYVHTFFLALTLLLMGILCFTSAEEIVETNLGRKIALGFGIFWFIRLIFQHFVYSWELWRGKYFETAIHMIFTILWTHLTFIFFSTYFGINF